jgi:hypothetical protein
MPSSLTKGGLTLAEIEAVASYYVPFDLATMAPGCDPDGPKAGAATKLTESIHPFKDIRYMKASDPLSSLCRTGNLYTEYSGLKSPSYTNHAVTDGFGCDLDSLATGLSSPPYTGSPRNGRDTPPLRPKYGSTFVYRSE